MDYSTIDKKIDSTIRFFLYLLFFWLPYSPAVIESCVIISLILWLIKRSVRLSNHDYLDGKRFYMRLGSAFRPASSPLNLPIAVFLTTCLISVLNSAFIGQSFHNFLTKTVEWFIVYFLVLEVFTTRKAVYILISVFIVTAAATGIDSFIQYYLTQKDIFLGHVIEVGARPTAGFKAPTGLGAYLTVVIPVSIALSFSELRNIFLRALSIIASILLVWSFIITGSRGAWLGIGVASIFSALIIKFSKDEKKLYTSLALLFTLSFLCVVFLLILAGSSSLDFLVRHDTISWRMSVWKESISMVIDRPLFGHGINTYMSLFNFYRSGSGVSPTYAHNCYIQLVVETGIIGLTSFLWILFVLFQKALKAIILTCRESKQMAILLIGLLSGILAFLVHSFFDTHFYSLQLSVYLWFTIGILIASMNMQHKYSD